MRRILKSLAGLTPIIAVLALGVFSSHSVLAQSSNAPTISGVSPSVGHVTGGDSVTISGTNFESASVVYFGINNAATTWVDETTLVAIAPAGYAGAIDISVTNSDQQRASMAAAYIYQELAPTITGLNPNVGPSTGGQTVTITGTNFNDGTKAVTSIDAYDNASGSATCAIYGQRDVQCWGYNGSGLGRPGTNGGYTTVPTPIDMSGALAGKTIRSLSAGAMTACVLASDDQPYCWGRGNNGALGNGQTAASLTPTPVDISGVLADKRFVKIGYGDQFGCVLSTEGKVYCWGLNNFGQLGANLAAGSSTVPVAVDTSGVLAGKTIVDITTGTAHTCVLSSDGLAYCWGRNDPGGRLGNGNTSTSIAPSAVVVSGALAGKTLRSIDAGEEHTCTVATDDTAYCWGSGQNGRLGNGVTTSSSSPVAVKMVGGLTNKTILSITAGFAHTCAVASDSQAYCWGSDTDGALGNGALSASVVPTAVEATGVLSGKTIRSIDAGYGTGCVIASDEQAYCWGRNYYAAGDGTTQTRQAPVAVIPWKGDAPRVTFDTALGTAPKFISHSELQVITPTHTKGLVSVTIQNNDNQSASLVNAYQYVDGPTASSVTPSSGSMDGATPITIRGTGFYGTMSVTVDGAPATDVQVINDTTITARTGAGTSPGAKNVVVTDQYGQTATLAGAFNYELPSFTITEVTPKKSDGIMATAVTVKGSGFRNWGAGSSWYTINFGSQTGYSVTFVDESTITLRVPGRAPGVVDVSISSPYGPTQVLEKGFTFVAPFYNFSNLPLTLSTGQEGKLTITSSTSSGPIASASDTLISLESSSTSGRFAIDLNEDESTRWSHNSVILPAGQSSVAVWYKDTTVGTPMITGVVGDNLASFNQQQAITSPFRFQVTGVSDPVASGTPSSVTVRAVDYAGAPAQNYTGTFSFSSTDSAAELPTQYTMTAADRGIKTFTNGVTLKTPGEFCVSATDTTHSVITGSQCDISVRTPNSGLIDRLAIISDQQAIPLNTSSASITVQARNSTDAIPVSADTPLYVTSNSPTMQFSQNGVDWSSAPFTLTVTTGSSSANLFARDSANRTSTISIKDLSTDSDDEDLGWTNTTQSIRTGVGVAKKLSTSGPSSLIAGAKGTYTLRLVDSTGTAVTPLQDYSVILSSSLQSTLFYTANNPTGIARETLIIPTGVSSIAFEMSDSTVSVGNNMTIAQAVDDASVLEKGEFELQVLSSKEASVSVTPSSANIESGAPSRVTLGLLGENGEQVYASQRTNFSLHTTSARGAYSLTSDPFTPINTASLERGEGTKELYYKDTLAGTAQLSARSPNLTSPQSDVTVGTSDAYRIGVTPSSRSAELQTASSAYTVTLYDIYGNVITDNTPRTLSLSSNETSIAFASNVNGPWANNTVEIAAGETSATFYAKGSEFIDAPATITISDELSPTDPDINLINASTKLTITSQLVKSIEFSTQEHSLKVGESSGVITVALKRPDGSPAIQNGSSSLSLTSSEGKIIANSDPSSPGITSLTVPKNESSISFYYSGEKIGTHSISAQAGIASASQSIQVTAGEPAAIVFTSPEQTLPAGQASEPFSIRLVDSYGNVTSSSTETTIQLASSCRATFSESAEQWQPVSSFVLPANTSQASFYMRSLDAGDCTVSASASNLTTASQVVTITSSGPVRLVIRGPTTLEREQTGSFSVDIVNEAGDVTAPESTTTINLSSSSSTGVLSRTELTFEPGQPTATFSYRDNTAAAVTLSANESGATLAGDTHALSVVNGNATQLSLTPPSSTIRADQQANLTIGLLNQYGASVPATESTTVSLSTDAQGGTFFDQNGIAITSTTFTEGDLSRTVRYSQHQTGLAILQAQAPSLQASSATVTVIPASISTIAFVSPEHTGSNALELGEAGEIEVALVDQYGNRAPTQDAITLYASTTGTGELSNNGIFTIPAGQSSGTFRYTQKSLGGFTVTVSDKISGSATLGPISQSGEFIYGAPANVRFNNASPIVERGGVSAMQHVELLNSHGYVVPAPAGGKEVRLVIATGTGEFALTPNSAFSETLTVTIPEGKSSGEFYYRNDDALIEQRECSDVSGQWVCETTQTYQHSIAAQVAVSSGTKVAVKQMKMIYGEPTRYAITTPQRQQQANKPTQPITVERQNRYGKPVPLHKNSSLTVETSANETGQIGISKTQWTSNALTILDSSATAIFYYKDAQIGQPQLTIVPAAEDASLQGDTQLVTITQATEPPAPATGLLVTNISDPQQQGTPSSVVVAAIDNEGFLVDHYTGTVSFTSDDPSALLPLSYTFKDTDRGWKTFTNQVAFASPGEKVVTARDENGLTGSQTDITVLGANNAPVQKVAFTSPSSPHSLKPGIKTPLTVQILDASGKQTVAPAGGFTVRLTSSVADGEFTQPGGSTTKQTFAVTIPEGLSFVTLSYGVSSQSNHEISVSDWQSSVDQESIENDTLIIHMDEVPVRPEPPVNPPVSPSQPGGAGSTDAPGTGEKDPEDSSEKPGVVLPEEPETETSKPEDKPQENVAGTAHASFASIAVGALVVIVPLISESIRHVRVIRKLQKSVSIRHISLESMRPGAILASLKASPFASAYFWLPIVGSIALTIVATIVMRHAAIHGVALSTIITGVVVVAALDIAFIVHHSNFLSRIGSALKQ